MKWLFTVRIYSISRSALSLQVFPQFVLHILNVKESDSATLATKHKLQKSPLHGSKTRHRTQKIYPKPLSLNRKNAKQRSWVFFDLVVSTTNAWPGSQRV